MMQVKLPLMLLTGVLLMSSTSSVKSQQPIMPPPTPYDYKLPSKQSIAQHILKEAQQDWQFPKTGRITKIEPTDLQQIQGFIWISATVPTWKITLETTDQRLVFVTNSRASVTLLIKRENKKLSKQVPKSVIQAVQRSIASTVNPRYKNDPMALQPYQVLIKTASRQQWPDGCLGKPKPGEPCTFATVNGWLVIAEGKLTKSCPNCLSRFRLRVDATGKQVRSDLPDASIS